MNDFTQRLTTTQRQNIMKLLHGAATDVASVLALPQDLVRSNLFEMTDNERVRIISSLTFNMNRGEELTISLPVLHMNSGASAWLASASNGKLTVFLMKKRSRFDWDAFFSVH